MKKYWKLSTVILASSMLLSGGVALLTNKDTDLTNNQALLNEFSKDLQVNERAITEVGDIEITRQYSTPNNFAIARSNEGDRVYAWGQENSFGQLGIGHTNSVTVPTQVKGLPSDAKIKFVSSGGNFTLIVLADNSIWATGKNDYGQFGNGKEDTTAISEFTEVRKASTVVISAIGVGYYTVAAIMDDKLYTWGSNGDGDLDTRGSRGDGALGIGDSSVKSKNVPQEITSIPSTEKLGELKVSENAFFVSTLNTTDNTMKDLYAWGDNYLSGLGGGIRTTYWNPQKIYDIEFSGKLTGFYPMANKVYFTTLEGSKNRFYGGGYTEYNALGNGNNKESWVFKVSIIPTDVQIANVWGGADFTLAVTTEGDIYSCGSADTSLLPADNSSFENAPTSLKGFKDFYGSSSSDSKTPIFAIKDNQLYAWGPSSSYGTGGSDTSYTVPTLIYPFSTKRSNFKQVKMDSMMLPSTLANSIYNSTTGLNKKVFEEWIQNADFPDGTTFSMTTAPTVNTGKGEVELLVTASGSYSQPDGARTLTTTLPITLTGFKAIDSNLIIKGSKPWIDEFEYENVKTVLGEGDATDEDNLKTIYDLDTFPTTSVFKINTPKLTLDSGTKLGTYTANLVASEYYFDSKLLKDGTFKMVLNDFPTKFDSSIIARTDIDSYIYYLSDIDNKLRPGNVLEPTVFADLFTATNFADGNTFTSVTGEVVDKEYHVTVKADKAYVDGLIVSKDFELVITGLSEFQVERTANNTGLIAGLSVCGVALLLIIIGLLIWYLKRRNKDNDDDEWILY